MPCQHALRCALTFKHVNGPAKWSSYAKAKYIAEIHQKYNIELAEKQLYVVRGYGKLSADERKEVKQALELIDQAQILNLDRQMVELY